MRPLRCGWVVVARMVVLVVLGRVVRLGNRGKVEADRAKANELRAEGDRTRLHASEEEANAASADARARQARVEAEKLELEAEARARDARESRHLAEEHHQRAAALDPDLDGRREGAPERDERPQEARPSDDQRHGLPGQQRRLEPPRG